MFSPARVVDDHGDRSAVACSSTTSTVILGCSSQGTYLVACRLQGLIEA